ncbi:MAG TPA: MBL fold metallo-hydrolase [Acidobacteriota bacterium]
MPIVPILDGRAYAIDLLFRGAANAIAAFLLPGPDGRFGLIECGPESCLPALRKGVEEAGFELEDLTAVAVTHIHLDHAGAAGALAQAPNVRVLVHPKGAPHLLDPSRLWDSASRLYGDKMAALWGGMTPVPAAQLQILQDGEAFDLAGWKLRAIATPGHAFHHHAYASGERELFCGDIAGIRLPGVDYVQPPTPPPELHLEAWLESIERIQGLKPRELLLTHFGAVEADPAQHLAELRARLIEWGERILNWMRNGLSQEQQIQRLYELVAEELRSAGVPPQVEEKYGRSSVLELCLFGYQRYWRKLHPERLA